MFGKPRIKATAIFLAALLFSPLAASQLDISLPDVDCKNPSEWFGAGSGNPGGGPSNSLTDATGCEGQDGAASRNDNSPDQGTGNPINVISGNKFLREVDYANKRGGLGLEFVRYYNSRNQKNFRLGVGWSYSFNTVVVGVRTLKPSDQKQIQVHQADGRNLYFTREKNTDLLRTDLQSDGHIKTTDIGYTWHWPNGRQLYFDDRGLLDNITQGNAQIDLHRNADGQLLAAEDQNGRRLSFRFQQGYLAYVKTPDGRKIKFRYYKSGHLVEVERAAGAIRKYEYNHPGNNALLTKVTNEKG
ncbi:MAG: DUF6531 domain-containing protein, partial [Cellvibrionaceae bacterium]|nr:DUF6531 domain-containing protein [Cellvibrionaceae bacterium]